jgi:predicted DNA-binding protein
MLLNGESASHIAKALHVHYNAVRAMLCDPQFRAELKELSEEVHRRVVEQFKSVREHINQRLEEMTDLALDELEELVANGSTEKTKLTAIDSVLDRNPLTSRRSIAAPSGAGPAPAQLAVFLQIAASTARELDTRTVTATPADAEAPVSEPVS